MRIFHGQVGWEPGQLVEELQSDTWVMLRAEPYVLETVWKLGERPGGDPWALLMQRLGGEFASYAQLPQDAGQQLLLDEVGDSDK